ncbi:hypothetical protein HWV62_19153 [Athelia sp. TMB]|nr:hypothetical protein HWV62_19153 [Athelia sp. TMB]
MVRTLTTISPSGTRLMEQADDVGGDIEAVLRVQGALCYTALPPIRSGNPLPDRGEARYMKQNVRLTGLGNDNFTSAIAGLANIAIFMGENMERGDIESWKTERFRTWQALDISNRFFVMQNGEGDMSSVPFADGVDPDGVLATMAGEKWVHTEDNQVQYFRLNSKSDGTLKYGPAKPADFKVGDLVEAQFSAVAVRRRNQNDVHSLKLVLRALTLLDDTYTKAARADRLRVNTTAPSTPSRGLKRNVGYLDEEIGDSADVPTSKMTKLCINEVTMD